MSTTFLTPSQATSADRLKLADLEGCLVIMQPTGAQATTASRYGDSTYTPVRVAVVAGATELTGRWHDLWVFAKVLQSQLAAAANAGSPLVGEVTRGDAAPGQSAPWLLADPDAAALEHARAAYTVLTGGTPTPPPATAANTFRQDEAPF